MSEQTTPSTDVRPGALVALIGLDRPALDVAADLAGLDAKFPGLDLKVSNGSGCFEVRIAGDVCGCHTCSAEDQQVRTDSGLLSWWSGINSHFMILCPDCGNKRCPKATNHVLACSGSNDVGQPGSIYV